MSGPRNSRILLVEDDPVLGKELESDLQEEGFSPLRATTLPRPDG